MYSILTFGFNLLITVAIFNILGLLLFHGVSLMPAGCGVLASAMLFLFLFFSAMFLNAENIHSQDTVVSLI